VLREIFNYYVGEVEFSSSPSLFFAPLFETNQIHPVHILVAPPLILFLTPTSVSTASEIEARRTSKMKSFSTLAMFAATATAAYSPFLIKPLTTSQPVGNPNGKYSYFFFHTSAHQCDLSTNCTKLQARPISTTSTSPSDPPTAFLEDRRQTAPPRGATTPGRRTTPTRTPCRRASGSLAAPASSASSWARSSRLVILVFRCSRTLQMSRKEPPTTYLLTPYFTSSWS